MPKVTNSTYLEVGEDRYSIEFTYPAPLLEGRTSEEILLVPKHFLCDSVIRNHRDGTFLVCRRLIDTDIGEIIYADSSGNPSEGSAEIPYTDTES
jgi:hypothetical protein